MQEQDLAAITAWLTENGLAGLSEPELLRGFTSRCRAAGLPLTRGLVFIDTLHPVYEGRAFPWRHDREVEQVEIAYMPTNQGNEREANWRATTFYHLWDTGGSELRRCFVRGAPADYRPLDT